MKADFLAKAAALVMTCAGVLGVAYGIAKYVNDFENAKAEIQNLRGQITQLHEVLAKTQSKVDDGRLERLEKQVAALQEAGTHQVAAKPVGEYLAAGRFSGTATDGASVWPFRASNVRLEAGNRFEADLEWLTLDAVHRVEGLFSDSKLTFKETEFVKKGNNVIGCEYTLDTPRNGGLFGTYRNCEGNASGGTVEVTWW